MISNCKRRRTGRGPCLSASLSLLPDPADPAQAAALGVAVHGLTVFGDPGARMI